MTRESGRWSTGIQVLYRDVATDLYLTRAVGGTAVPIVCGFMSGPARPSSPPPLAVTSTTHTDTRFPLLAERLTVRGIT